MAFPPPNEYYGDNMRWFMGLVVDINDPKKLDRVKVRIFGIHTSDTGAIPNDKLPWAQVLIPVTEGGSSGIGANSQLKVRAFVFGLFLDGKNSQNPLVLGSIPKQEGTQNDKSESSSVNTDINTENVNVPGAFPFKRPFAKFNNGLGSLRSDTDNIDGRPGAPLKGNTNNEKAVNFFLSDDGGKFKFHQVAGIMGNLITESGDANGQINPNRVSSVGPKIGKNKYIKVSASTIDDALAQGGEGSYGIAQWNPHPKVLRFQDLVAWCSKENLDHTKLYPQLKFIIIELEDKPSFHGLTDLRNSKNVEQATEIFRAKFERNDSNDADKKIRLKYALEIYNKFGPGSTIPTVERS